MSSCSMCWRQRTEEYVISYKGQKGCCDQRSAKVTLHFGDKQGRSWTGKGQGFFPPQEKHEKVKAAPCRPLWSWQQVFRKGLGRQRWKSQFAGDIQSWTQTHSRRYQQSKKEATNPDTLFLCSGQFGCPLFIFINKKAFFRLLLEYCMPESQS